MTTGLVFGSGTAPAATRADIPDAVRIGTIVAILLVMIVGADPFHDRSAVDNIESGAGGNLLNQVLYLAVGAASGVLVLTRGVSALRPLATVPILATLAWFVVTTLTSIDPAVSARRLLSLLIVMLAAVAILVLARSVRQFAAALGGTVLAILVVSYLGLALVPELSTHTALDLIEHEHAGSWRGMFSHKNAAGVFMAVFLFVGLFWARAGQRWLGLTVAALSAVFLAFTNSKTSIALVPVVLVATWLCGLSAAGWWRRLVLLAPVALLLTATVGSVLVPSVGDLVTRALGDATFTGRTEIWQFALDNIARRPITGFGYGAFWESVFYGGGADAETWVNRASTAHNGLLNTALDIGLPGLALTVWWLVVSPVADLQARTGAGRIDPVRLLFVRIWLFALLAATFETVLYHATNGLFFAMVMSAFGLRYLACADAVEEAGPA